MVEREYVVAGMHCASCVALVTEDVEALDGVERVEVSLDEGRARVRFDPARVDDARIVAAIRGSGYEAKPVGGSGV